MKLQMASSVLLVDDEREFCAQAKKYLDNLGHDTTVVTDGKKALEIFSQIKPDVVVLDVDLKLDDLDGRVLCSQLCQKARYKSGELAIILISGHYVSCKDEIAGFEVGADNYLTKPFEMIRLAAVINALQRRISKLKSNVIQIDAHLTLDIKRRKVFMDAEEIRLTRLEFELLSYLSQPPNTSRTKHELFENVWREQHVAEGAIAKCVSLLRKKLCSEDPDRYLKTVFGVGYILIAQN